MMRRIIRKIKNKLKGPLTERMYAFLMREAYLSPGRQLFDSEELKLLCQALLSQNLFGIGGTMVPEFEKEFATAYGVPHAVASTSGTAAIHTALGALDLNPGDEVITAPITDMGTIIPILYQQCIPVFADIDHTYNMDPQDIERKITDRTKAILVVHLFGNPCDMDAIMEIAKKHKIPVIEDCAQAHMTEYKGKYVGTIGDIGCFSFQQAKHMTTGDGGMVVTSNKTYFESMKLFVDKGYARKGWGSRAYLFLAPNYRMNELTAAVGIAQLKKVKGVVAKRNELGEYLSQLISSVKGVTIAPVTAGSKGSYWLYPLYLNNINIDDFSKEMVKEKFWVGAGYTGKPIYLCSDSLTAKKTFGNSHFPFSPKITDKIYEYKEGLCPRAEDTLRHLICIWMDESWGKEKVENCAQAIAKCVEILSVKSTGTKTTPQTAQAVSPVKVGNETKKIRIGIIGCGQMGTWHWESYRNNSDVQMVAFCDTELSRAERFARKIPVNVYTDYRQMIHKEKLDGVSVCTVPSTHKQIVLDSLEAGINVLCEKPLAISVEEGQAMFNKAQEKKLLLLAAHKFRFFEEVVKAKQLLDKNSFGRIMNFRLMFGGYIDMGGTWYVNKEISGGGIIMDNGPHAFDLIRYLLGEFKQVSAKTNNFQNLEVEDSAQISCVLENGAQGIIDISWSSSVPARSYLEIYGEDGAVLLDFEGITYKFKTWSEWKRIPNKISIKEAFDHQINHFVEAIVKKAPLIIQNQDGLNAQAVINAAYQSILENNRVATITYK
ncbi:MAG: aminotransferase class V-fold PLP-dependent enzyme [Nanoarchaeota archaeon]